MVFLTQDAMPADKNTVSHLVKALNSQENIGAAYARQLPNSSCSLWKHIQDPLTIRISQG